MLRFGGLAQLARAFDWQSKGQRFDSAILHKRESFAIVQGFFCFKAKRIERPDGYREGQGTV